MVTYSKLSFETYDSVFFKDTANPLPIQDFGSGRQPYPSIAKQIEWGTDILPRGAGNPEPMEFSCVLAGRIGGIVSDWAISFALGD